MLVIYFLFQKSKARLPYLHFTLYGILITAHYIMILNYALLIHGNHDFVSQKPNLIPPNLEWWLFKPTFLFSGDLFEEIPHDHILCFFFSVKTI